MENEWVKCNECIGTSGGCIFKYSKTKNIKIIYDYFDEENIRKSGFGICRDELKRKSKNLSEKELRIVLSFEV